MRIREPKKPFRARSSEPPSRPLGSEVSEPAMDGIKSESNVAANHLAVYIGYECSLYLSTSKDSEYCEILGRIQFAANLVRIISRHGSIQVRPADNLENLAERLSKAINLALLDGILEVDGLAIEISEDASVGDIISSLESVLADCPDLFMQAYQVGTNLKRIPYEEYLENGFRDSFFEVVYHGRASLEEGILVFDPDLHYLHVTPKGGAEFTVVESHDPIASRLKPEPKSRLYSEMTEEERSRLHLYGALVERAVVASQR